ncbi:MAG TPA: hypothetical protein VIK56_15610 [Rhodoferax sp.]
MKSNNMPSITITLTDTPNGAVSIHSTYRPAIGNPCSPAQAHALDIISRTHKLWGVHIDAAHDHDIDTVRRVRDRCSCDPELTMQADNSNCCTTCGKALL